AGNLYVSDGRIQKRDAQGNWSVIATQYVSALAVDPAGSLYVAGNDIQKRDAQGNWSVIATQGTGPGQLVSPTEFPVPTAGLGQVDFANGAALAVDTAANVYVTDWSNGGRIQKRDT